MGSLHWKSGKHSCFGVLLDTYISILFFNKTLKVHHFVFLHWTWKSIKYVLKWTAQVNLQIHNALMISFQIKVQSNFEHCWKALSFWKPVSSSLEKFSCTVSLVISAPVLPALILPGAASSPCWISCVNSLFVLFILHSVSFLQL